MELKRLEIKNFRDITGLDLELKDTTVLIGENNTGKTAVLDALRFALRDVRTRRGCVFEEYDFHLPTATAEPSTAPPISIRLTFKEDTPGQWDEQQVARLTRARILQVGADQCSLVILDVSAQFDETTRDFSQDWEFQNVEGAPLTRLADSALGVFHNEVSYYYLSALRDATRQFDSRGVFWRPFLKKSQLTPEKRQEIESKLSEINNLIVSSHTSFSQVVSRLKDIQNVVSVANGGEDIVSVEAVPGRIFDMLSKASVNLNTTTGAKIPVGRHGEGTQSLAVLTLFNAYLQAWNEGHPIVALEEPEAHLHPSAVRALWQLIEKIPGQKILSTHSGDLLSEVPPESVVRIYKEGQNIKASRLGDIALDLNDVRKFNFHIRRDRGELLFSRCWILGEGETEGTLIPEVARILEKNLEQAGIRVVTYQSGISLETCLKVANGMGIHWVVLTDNDRRGRINTEIARGQLNGRTESEVLFTMNEANIEEYLCCNGFQDVYKNLLGEQPLKKVTVESNDPEYPLQIAQALPSRLKTQAVPDVLTEIQNNSSLIPNLLRNVIDAALQLVKTV